VLAAPPRPSVERFPSQRGDAISPVIHSGHKPWPSPSAVPPATRRKRLIAWASLPGLALAPQDAVGASLPAQHPRPARAQGQL